MIIVSILLMTKMLLENGTKPWLRVLMLIICSSLCWMGYSKWDAKVPREYKKKHHRSHSRNEETDFPEREGGFVAGVFVLLKE
jgi:threonine/homoserine/homoserine lactone efflux protein